MTFADIHLHALFGVDDGAKSEAQMREIIDATYADGARVLCLTPHFHPGYFGDNRHKTAEAFALLQAYCRETHPDLELYLGNELRFSKDCLSWLADGVCRTLNCTEYVLVDFSQDESLKNIVGGLNALLNGGYTPILAHVERYESLGGQKRLLENLGANGVLFQMDTCSLFGGFGLGAKLRAKALLSSGLVDIVASDGHDLDHRPPGIEKSFRYIEKKYGQSYAQALCWENPQDLLRKTAGKKD